MIDTISGLRAYALKHARALRVLRSVKSQGQADAYQDMGHRLSELEKQADEREKLVREVIRLTNAYEAAGTHGTRSELGEAVTRLLEANLKLAEFRP